MSGSSIRPEHENGRDGGEPLAPAGEPEPVCRRRRHADRCAASPRQDVARLVSPGAEAGLVTDELHRHVADRAAGSHHTSSRLDQQLEPAGAGPSRVRRTEDRTEVAEACGAQQGVAGGVGDDVAVGVSGQAVCLVRPVQPGQPQRAPALEPVHVDADADPRGACHGGDPPALRPAREVGQVAANQAAVDLTREHGDVTPSPRAAAALAGAAAGAGGLAVAELVSALLRVRVSPVLAVGETVIELTPGAVAEGAIDAVGRADKPLLVTGVVVGLLGLSALAGVLMLRRRGASLLLFAVLPVVALVAGLARPDARPADVLPPAIGGVAGMVLALWLVPTAARTGESASRRRLLVNVGAALAGAAVLGGLSRLAGRGRRTVEEARRAVSLGLRPPSQPPGVDLGVDGVAPWLTPNQTFYRIDTSLAPPLLEPSDWELRIHGLVERELRLTYADLVERGLQTSWVTLCCVSNEIGGELLGNASWTGVRIDDLLRDVGVSPDADAVLSRSSDGWTCGTPLAALTDGRDALLAVAMNGEPLPVEHGFPVRMVVPGLYGYVSATKWVVDWEVTRFDRFDAYWTERGWSEEGPIKTQSRIDTPRDGTSASTARVPVGGVAWAQQRGIERVEVRVDDGDWHEAALGRVPNVDTWVQWVWQWDPEPGRHTLTVRATDADGVTQPEQRTDVVPDGSTGWHTVSVDVA